MKSLLTPTLVTVSVLLAACQGQNPFKFQANPAKGNAAFSSPQTLNKYSTETKNATPVMPDNTQNVCWAPMHTSIDGIGGSQVLRFVEGSATSHKLHIVNTLGSGFKIDLGSLPAGVSVGATSTGGAILDTEISWNPARGTSQTSPVTSLNLNYSWDDKSKCGGFASTPINMIVSRTSITPSLEIKGLSQTTIEFSSEPIPFQILVTDPAATKSQRPALSTVPLQGWMQNAGNVLDASSGVSCPDVKDIDLTHVQYNCHLIIDSLKLAGKDKINSGKTFSYAFAETVTSLGGSATSAAIPSGTITVHFADQSLDKKAELPADPKTAVVEESQAEPKAVIAGEQAGGDKAPVVNVEVAPKNDLPIPVPRPKDLDVVVKTPAPVVAANAKVVNKVAAPTVVAAVKAPAKVTTNKTSSSSSKTVKSAGASPVVEAAKVETPKKKVSSKKTKKKVVKKKTVKKSDDEKKSEDKNTDEKKSDDQKSSSEGAE